MQRVGPDVRQQVLKRSPPCTRGMPMPERQEVIVNSVANEPILVIASLDDRNSRTTSRGSLCNVDQGRPSLEQFTWRTALGIPEEPDLRNVELPHVDAAAHRLETRGSHSLTNRFEKSSSHGRS